MSAPPTVGRLLGAWSFEAALALALLAIAGLYLRGALGLGSRWPLRRTASFIVGLAVLALALMSGIDSYAEQLLSVHMLQHLLLALLAPALLLAGAPVRLALAAGPPRLRRRVARALRSRPGRALAHPLTGCTLFAATMLVTHLTGVFELALEHPAVHATEHAAYFLSGVALLAPLIAADPVPHPPAPLARFAWLMVAMTAMAVPGALLALSQHVHYSHYLATSRALGRSPLTDQQLGGAIMWIGGTLAMFALALWLALATMVAEERRQRRRELHAARREARA
jgi:cytochrome c oxidase assembly factor CtaG